MPCKDRGSCLPLLTATLSSLTGDKICTCMMCLACLAVFFLLCGSIAACAAAAGVLIACFYVLSVDTYQDVDVLVLTCPNMQLRPAICLVPHVDLAANQFAD